MRNHEKETRRNQMYCKASQIRISQRPLVCRDNDFNTALSMVKILVQHTANVFQQLPSEAVTESPKNQKQQFLDDSQRSSAGKIIWR